MSRNSPFERSPLVDVIVPIFGVEKYIDRCLWSLKRQSYRNFRVLMVDDGSLDCSGAIAETYADEARNFVYLHKTNGGTGSARNFGIEQSEGDLLMFVDPDDWVEPDYIASL